MYCCFGKNKPYYYYCFCGNQMIKSRPSQRSTMTVWIRPMLMATRQRAPMYAWSHTTLTLSSLTSSLPGQVTANSRSDTDVTAQNSCQTQVRDFWILLVLVNRPWLFWSFYSQVSYRIVPNRRPPPFFNVKQSMKMYLSDAKMQWSRCYNYWQRWRPD